MTPGEWIPIAVAIIAASSTISVQLWLNRGEQPAIKRIKLLSEAIATMPESDPGAEDLKKARTVLASRLSKSLVGAQGIARVFRIIGWTATVVGSVLFLAWLVLVVVDPTLRASKGVMSLLTFGLTSFVLGPVFLFYSSLWPQFERAFDSIAVLVRRPGSRNGGKSR